MEEKKKCIHNTLRLKQNSFAKDLGYYYINYIYNLSKVNLIYIYTCNLYMKIAVTYIYT
jgi:hypothetical protein